MKLLSTMMLLVHFAALSMGQEAGKSIPLFKIKGTDGKVYTNETVAKKPTVIVLLMKGCPHNPKAAPDFNRLRASFGSKADVIGLVVGKPPEMAAYAKEIKADFPLLADPSGDLVHAMGGRHSLDLALVSAKDKMIAKTWDGYDRKIIGEIIADLPGHGGPKLKVDLTKYPGSRRSGCAFM